MNRYFVIAALIGGFALSGAGFAQQAEAAQMQAVAPVSAAALDKVDAEFTRHNREHRMWEIQRRTEMQQRGRGYGPPPGRGYRRGDGYGYDRGYGDRRERRYGY